MGSVCAKVLKQEIGGEGAEEQKVRKTVKDEQRPERRQGREGYIKILGRSRMCQVCLQGSEEAAEARAEQTMGKPGRSRGPDDTGPCEPP